MTAKDQFQIICFENNNAAFFAETVVLVEGDSDFLLFPHIAKILNPAWDVAKLPVHFARISGKGNIRRYRDFFRRFGVRVAVVADLDLLLGGFQHVPGSESVQELRNQLITRVDQLVEADEESKEVTSKEAKKAHSSRDLRALWREVRLASDRYFAGQCADDLACAMGAFLGWQRKSDRLSVLMNSDDTDLLQNKWKLLDALRQLDVYVLERGAIESYYPDSIVGPDKPTLAQNFCEQVSTRDAVLECCGKQNIIRESQVEQESEFTLIFEGIFNQAGV